MTKGRLSDRQRRMLDFIRHFSDENGYPPSIRDIGKAVGISSTSVVNYNLNRLVEEGYVRRDQNVSRGIRLSEKLTRASQQVVDTLRIPLVGRIFASEPVPLPSTDSLMFGVDEAIEITRDMIPSSGEDLFALEVKGDSMIDAMVNDGDIDGTQAVTVTASANGYSDVSKGIEVRDDDTLDRRTLGGHLFGKIVSDRYTVSSDITVDPNVA